MVWREPLRGGFMDPGFGSLPGIERMQAVYRGLVPIPPLTHLIGTKLTQVGAGSATMSMPATPWLAGPAGTEPSLVIMPAMQAAVLTTVGPGVGIRPKILSVSYARVATPDAGSLLARARVLHTRRTIALAEAVVEDAEGRLLAHASGMIATPTIDPPPPPAPAQLRPVEEPTYPTPDPYLRPLPGQVLDARIVTERGGLETLRQVAAGELPTPGGELVGVRLVDVSEGRVTFALPITEWLCNPAHLVDPGFIALMISGANLGAAMTLLPPRRSLAMLDLDVKFLRDVRPDGRDLLTRATVVHRDDELAVATAEALDADGNRVALGASTSTFLEPRPRGRAGEPERVLATVLFTDIVGSTERANELGDARWAALLEEHHALVRKELAIFKGREVKTTGDGFLATFDSPARAVQCARAVRDDVRRLAIELRAGLHTGECEVMGADIGGISVHIADRVASEASPGEILVSSTVRDLVTGSGLRFTDRGRHALKGVEGEWQLYAVED